VLDKAIVALPTIHAFLQQSPTEIPSSKETIERMLALPV